MEDLYAASFRIPLPSVWFLGTSLEPKPFQAIYRSLFLSFCSTIDISLIDWYVDAKWRIFPFGAANTPLSGHFRCFGVLVYCMASTKQNILVGCATNYISQWQEMVVMQSGELIAFSTNSIARFIPSCQAIIDLQRRFAFTMENLHA